MILTFRFPTTTIVQVVLVMLAVHTPRAYSEEPNAKAPDKLRLSKDRVTGPSVPTDRRFPTSVEWHGREYDVDSGIGVLMTVLRDPLQRADERQRALLSLVMLDRRLEGHSCLDELARVYDDASESDKHGILLCFLGLDDPRGIPVFIRTLDNEQDLKLRLWAAGALAHWNIRRGVAELVLLIESNETLPHPGHMPKVRDNALDSFRAKNRIKGWGFPANEWWKSIDDRADLDTSQKRALYHAERENEIKQIKKWFEANKERFPDWKPGDPLPEASKPESKQPREE